MAEGERSQPSLPKSIGRYQIQASLGAGAMGAVYKGFDPLIKRTLAIKTIRLDIPRGSEEYKMFLERFYQEARISGTLSHPNIVTLFDIGEDNGLPFLALEFIEGETVEGLLARGVKFRPEKVIGLISQIAAALDYAHSKGVIHRDIKPANLLIYEEDRVKVTDFGIAKLADVEMTKVGQLLGTPSYMSPEQAMGEKLDGRSDIFSLGVCAFEMLCGKQPFPGNNVTAILYRLVHMEPIEPDNLEMNGLIPQKWHEVFPKVLSKKRDDRYQTAADFVRDLEYCLGTWFSGLGGEDLVPTASVPAPSISPDPAPAQPPANPMMARKADDPSVVVSMDEIQEAVTGQRPSGPAVPEDDDLPPTIAVSRPAMPPPNDDDPPPTLPIQRPPIVQEKTIVLPTPTRAAQGAPPAPPAQASAQAATRPVVSKPSSNPPFKPVSQYKPSSNPPYRPLPPASRSQPPRLPGPGSRVPAPAAELEEALETEEVDRPSGGIPKLWLALGAGLVLVLVALGVLIARRTGGGGGSGDPPRPVIAGNAAIQVETTPSGAKIKLNDLPKGSAPTSLTGLAPGTYEVLAELTGHEPAFQKVTLRQGQASIAVKLTLQPTQSGTGEADILSLPPGATITMDGQKVGQTPLRGYKLPVGNRRFRLTTEGFEPFTEYLLVQPGKAARLDARMVPLGGSPPPQQQQQPPPSTQPTPPPTLKPVTSSAAGTTAKPAPTTTVPAVPVSAVPTTTLAAAPPPAPVRPSVDTTRVYMENEVDTAPRKLSGDAYSPKLKSGESLSVTLQWVVGESGEVGDVAVLESGGKALDEQVMQSVRKWKYAAGVKQGVKVKVQMARKYTFKAG
jgi:TonB family protein